MVKGMAVVVMAWVDGILYLVISFFSSFIIGGEKGRGYFKMFLVIWLIYIINCKIKGWGEFN